ncbi:MAG TPA: type II 3-dehydroquinate dehydratase [Burkholderiales bacterium]|nr:type II 3-dehydroquinate dehydratase [Burkholderiales bacterium]
MRILVLHGPNLNLLGRREPHIYGKETLADIDATLEALARELGAELVTVQSNHEGVLIDTLHSNIDSADGAIINPAGITHYGVPLRDAIAAMPFPVIEIHLSNLAARVEEWRHHSMISPVVAGTVQGLGWRSYTTALRAVVEIAREKKKASPR